MLEMLALCLFMVYHGDGDLQIANLGLLCIPGMEEENGDDNLVHNAEVNMLGYGECHRRHAIRLS